MPDPITLPSYTPAIGLPLLIAGQAQKEFFVNQALCLLDALQAGAVSASLATPPAAPAEGTCYRIIAPATLAWAGKEGSLALNIGGDWHFVVPREGMQVFDQSAGQQLVFRSGWEHAVAPASPVGGSVVDTEARAAITALIQSLLTIGIVSPISP